MSRSELLPLALALLEDSKARDVAVLDVRRQTSVADYLVVATGTSDRHVRAIADRVLDGVKGAGHEVLGTEGKDSGEWVLIDLNDVIVHVMQGRTREFYKLEDLWSTGYETASDSSVS